MSHRPASNETNLMAGIPPPVMNVSYRNPGPFAAIGFLAAFALAVIITVAINADVSWVYGESKLLDLGISDVDLTKNLFNYGRIIVGILIVVFGVGKAYTENGCNCASGCFVAFAGVFLIIAGFMQANSGNSDTVEAAALFTCIFQIVAMALSAVGDWKDGAKLNAALSSILILIIIGCLVGMNIEKVQVIAVACYIVWMIGVSAKMTFDSRKAA